MSSECSTAAVPTGASGNVCWPLARRAAFAEALFPPALPPEFSSPQAPPGMNTWWNANAGAAITLSISAEANAAARTLLSLLNLDLLRLLPYGGTYGRHASPGLPIGANLVCNFREKPFHILR